MSTKQKKDIKISNEKTKRALTNKKCTAKPKNTTASSQKNPKDSLSFPSHRPITLSVKKISATNILRPPIKDRFDIPVQDETDYIPESPLVVLQVRGQRSYVIVEGLRNFNRGVLEKVAQFRCLIIGEVNDPVDATVERLARVLALENPFNLCEQAIAIWDIRERFGNEKFYAHGGNRRGKTHKKLSFIEVLKKEYPHRSYLIGVLGRFVDNVGPYAIKGLHDLLISNRENLSVSRVHRANGFMARTKLRKEIDTKVRKMNDDEATNKEIIHEVGLMVYKALFQQPKREKRSRPTQGCFNVGDRNNKSKSEGQTSGDPNIRKYGGIDSKKLLSIKKEVDLFIQEAERLQSFLKSKKRLTIADSEIFHKIGDRVQDAFEAFWLPFTAVESEQ
ncbi:MAG: hypothetical protein JRF31_12340 [Deltaproteobacteria bacterium]|nr:hypothetical protein [Deltaproteobacteria bacterium]